VRIAVGRPGVDHDSVDYCVAMGTLVAKAASHPSQTPSVAEVIGKLVVALGDDAGAASC
jgi:formylmethanofuran dehydrogenase subunit B